MKISEMVTKNPVNLVEVLNNKGFVLMRPRSTCKK